MVCVFKTNNKTEQFINDFLSLKLILRGWNPETSKTDQVQKKESVLWHDFGGEQVRRQDRSDPEFPKIEHSGCKKIKTVAWPPEDDVQNERVQLEGTPIIPIRRKI